MLRSLYIRDYALIDELEVAFDPGLNVLTGETGAGKSIVVGALKLALGERASKQTIRTGATKTVVEAHFSCSNDADIDAILERHDLDRRTLLIVRREVTPDHSRAFVNDSPATIQVVRELTDRLIDLHGQHEHQSLLKTPLHLDVLIRYAGAMELAAGYKAMYTQRRRLHTERSSLLERRESVEQQRDLVAFQIDDIDAVAPGVDEEDDLLAELRLLDNMGHVMQTATRLYHDLYAGDPSIYDRLAAVARELEELGRLDARFETMSREVETAGIAVGEVSTSLQEFTSNTDFSADRHELVRERLGQFDDLKRKYGGSIEAVLQHRQKIGRVFDEAVNFDAALRDLDNRITAADAALGTSAAALSNRLRSTARTLESSVEDQLASLGFGGATFAVDFSRDTLEHGGIAVAGDGEGRFKPYPDGVDKVEFLLTANAGEPARPLATVASGGEVSRIMLALKSVLAGSDRIPTLIFDEIDAGISGSIAHRVGKAMKELSSNHQLLVITHLPQIAALADTHFSVSKTTSEKRAVTRLSRLSESDRAREVASLLSGDTVTEAALSSARELIRKGLGG